MKLIILSALLVALPIAAFAQAQGNTFVQAQSNTEVLVENMALGMLHASQDKDTLAQINQLLQEQIKKLKDTTGPDQKVVDDAAKAQHVMQRQVDEANDRAARAAQELEGAQREARTLRDQLARATTVPSTLPLESAPGAKTPEDR